MCSVSQEPDFFEVFAGHHVANLLDCPECFGEGEIDLVISQPRRSPVFDKAECPTCKGDGLVFPSEIASVEAR